MYLCKSRITLIPLATTLALPVYGQDQETLQKQLANPVAEIITLPFQYTATARVAPGDAWQHTLNFQPVIPTKLNAEWNLINRAIVPLLSNPGLPGEGHKTGLGDITYEAFFTPAHPAGDLIWAIGPIITFDTASNDRLGLGKYSAGPAALVLRQPGPLTYGALVSQAWSFAGDDNRASVSTFQLQPILSYRLSPQITIGYTGTITSNWHGPSSQRWTLPLGLTFSKLTRPEGFVPVNYIVGAGYNVVRPDTAGTWFLRAQINFVIPQP